jgi:hypothetical protein
MEPITDHLALPLQWLQPKGMSRSYELYSGENLVARLDFQSAWGSLALAVTSAQCWTFKRVGFFNTRVTVRLAGSTDTASREEAPDIAVYRPNWRGEGWIETAASRKVYWRPANFWASRFLISAEDGSPLINYQEGVEHPHFADWFKTQAGVTIEYPARGIPETPMLILLGWYLILLQEEDSGAAAASTAAVV